ncbi:MAG: hypothetical protein WEB57_06430 [Pseudohongiellaceae bacterium]
MADTLELFFVMLAVASPVVLIVLIKQYFRYRSEVNARLAADDRVTVELKQEVALLRERLQAVETIVTDARFDLLKDLNTIR